MTILLLTSLITSYVFWRHSLSPDILLGQLKPLSVFFLEAIVRVVIGTLGIHDDDGSENITEKRICVLSIFIASIWNRSTRQMQATFPGVKFLRALSMFK